MTSPSPAQPATDVFPGADERTPSRAQYFTWINNTNEGPTEAQTLVNLAFFGYLHEQFGMVLDIYAFDAGAIDGAKFYGSTSSERFARQFPRGFGPSYRAARAIGTRLGVWGGPDGFGNSEHEANLRVEMMSGLCLDWQFALFKFDGVCGDLRADKRHHFVEMMRRCRQHSPDLILLNHRLDLGPEGLKHATTFLWEGAETYIDVHMANSTCATHNRAVALARGLPPDLKRLCEDHGVCLSSCLDYWDDDLILQAFNRCLILAPEIYGNPWLLRDDELPRLARIYNLHRRFRDILTTGIVLPPEQFGPHATSRGNATTRLVTLRNLSWHPVKYALPLDATLGLGTTGPFEVRRLHPHERHLGHHAASAVVEVEVLPFRACLILVTALPVNELTIKGCDYDVVCDAPGRPAVIDLLGWPGTTARVEVPEHFTGATLDGQPLASREFDITFPGRPMQDDWHRLIAPLATCAVPADAEALYEATCFAADNNALEVRELERSGPSDIPQVQAAREAFFQQPLFRQRNLWDRFLFDDDSDTAFAVSRRWPRAGELRIRRGAFRIDFGQAVSMDRLVLEVGHEQFLAPLKSQEGARCAVSADLRTWTELTGFITGNIEVEIPSASPVRYFRLYDTPELVRHVRGSYRGQALDRSRWRASNLFAPYRSAVAKHAWSAKFGLRDCPPGGYLALAIHGEHGNELAMAAIRAGEHFLGAPRRSPSYRSNTWECPVRQTSGNSTFYFPITSELIGRDLEAFAFVLDGGKSDVKVELWATAYPVPMSRCRLTSR